MNQQKSAQMIREFPFITNILTAQNLSADAIGNVEVMHGDRNLLEITPSAWAHDADQYGSHEGYRLFWCVSAGEVTKLENAWTRSIPYERNDQQNAAPIGSQLLSLKRDVQFVVGIHEERWDEENKTLNVTIYNMEGFNWRSYCRPTQVARS